MFRSSEKEVYIAMMNMCSDSSHSGMQRVITEQKACSKSFLCLIVNVLLIFFFKVRFWFFWELELDSLKQ